jgi:tRNA G37 N-methylase Trm5
MDKINEILKGKLTEKELLLVPKSFDVVGSILIFSEFPKELNKKEKMIGDAFLQELKNVKTICKKTKVYSGVYRTPRLKVIAGEKTKETTHKENGISLKLDVEKVYFSTRLSNERLRISKLIQPNEEILVMFSGCGVYPVVFAKNTPAKYIYGIEINPAAHKYALENIKINKINNIFVVNKDVKKSLPNFYQQNIGLKSSIRPKELPTRMKHNPEIIEIFTLPEDFEKNFAKLKKIIKILIDKGKQVFVHQPAAVPNKLDMTHNSVSDDFYQKLLQLIKEFSVSIIIHVNEQETENIKKEAIISNTLTFRNHYRNIYFENCSKGFPSKIEEIEYFIEKTKITNFCIDTCHLLHHYSPEELPKIIERIKSRCNTYFHLADYKDNYHAGKLGKDSHIQLEKVLPLINKGITEIKSKNELIGKEMIESWNYLKNFTKTFDRILMPLPRSAEDFLELALNHTKKGTVIHFYDFLKEDEFGKAKEKVSKACKKLGLKFKILNLVKCGAFGPRIYRICLDFQIV